MKNDRILAVYEHLVDHYGPQHWWPGETPFEVCIGAILTQNTAWTNVEKAIASLKNASALSADGIRALSEEELAPLIRPSGYYNAKARKLKAFVSWLEAYCGDDMEALVQTETGVVRKELLGIHGIGEETADSILLYAAKKPVFLVDAYTRRIFNRLGILAENASYGDVQQMFMESLPLYATLFNEYHALIVRHGKEICRKIPGCHDCCLAMANVTPDSPEYPCRHAR